MKEAIDFCQLQRGPFYLCPLGGWGRSSVGPMGLGRSPGGVADQRLAALLNHGEEGEGW